MLEEKEYKPEAYAVENKNEKDVKLEVKQENSPSKRRFLLISRPIKHEETLSTGPKNAKIRTNSQFACGRKLPIRISHRLCQICQSIQPVSGIKMVNDESEKLFFLLFGLYRRKISIDESIRHYKHPFIYTCFSHYSETCSEILSIFGVQSAAGLFRAKKRKVAQVLKLVNHITGKITEESRMMNLAYMFIMHNREKKALMGPMIKAEDIPVEETVECRTIETKEDIIPKCFRQPRKQRLETEENESMFRIIKQETLFLPKETQQTTGNELKNPVQCSYCLEVREKQNMVNIPMTKYRMTRWPELLGEEFGERAKSTLINYMCRKHFPQMAFSSRGRLRREAMPNIMSPPEITTFKIDGNEFVKVSEEELVKGQTGVIDVEQ